jgi:hypothetical protein
MGFEKNFYEEIPTTYKSGFCVRDRVKSLVHGGACSAAMHQGLAAIARPAVALALAAPRCHQGHAQIKGNVMDGDVTA